MKDIAISVKDVSMCFRMPEEPVSGLKEFVVKWFKRKLRYKQFWAVRDISLDIKKGEVVGIIGLNGAGKSTLLKMVAGVLKPTKGSVEIHGDLAPLIELGAGFDAELTARENVFLNGAILGHPRAEMEEKFDEIIEFAGLKEFVDTPIKNFSSGMYARLGFAIATIINPEILIVDEILSVGDFQFQEKSEKKIRSMMGAGTTVVMVSHTINQVANLCDRVVWLDHGKLVEVGPAKEVCERFLNQ